MHIYTQEILKQKHGSSLPFSSIVPDLGANNLKLQTTVLIALSGYQIMVTRGPCVV